MTWIIVAIVAVLFFIAYMIYKLPTDSVHRKRRKEKKVIAAATPADDKDWKEIATRWEKKNNALLGDLEKSLGVEKRLLKDIEAGKQHVKELLDKMALEKGWREKSEGNLEKEKMHEKSLKDQIMQTEKELEREHAMRMQYERDMQEMRIKMEALTEEKRQATVNAASLTTTVNQLRLDVKELTRHNETLKQKKDDVQWVAKSEYDALLRQFKGQS